MKTWLTISLFLLLSACQHTNPLFEKTDSAQTGVAFANQLIETEQDNILAFEYFYNGGGVAAGDFNNDGRPDLFFTGNQVDNKLYINDTGVGTDALKFIDVSAKAGITGRKGGWKTGVTLADVNADGWLDIYVCYSGLRPDSLRRNQLFINNKNLTFTDRATEYGLADSGYSMQATFFDYDLDGDLDCFLINHNLKNYQRKEAATMRAERDYNAGDKLFQNMTEERRKGEKEPERHTLYPFLPSSLSKRRPGSSHPLFVDVSEQEGIKGNPLGFGLGVSVADLNGDGYPDIYVTNDFVEDDYLYINQRGLTATGPAFRDELRERIEHTAYSAMGVDVADLNNDGLPDIFSLDMLPEDNRRQKLLLWPDSWQVYQSQLKNGFWHQNMRNTLQLQQQNGQFAEVGQLVGVSATDWSWGTLLADFDGDGRKDIFVSNGLGRDLTNADFVKYISDEESMQTGHSLLDQLKQMPSTPTKNYIFRNVSGRQPGDVAFENKQRDWGFDETTRANGSAYADLDGDGDLEIITNNLNEPARIYNNRSREQQKGHYLAIQLKGPLGNPFGVGAIIQVQSGSSTQTQAFYPTRGYLSCSADRLLFGFGESNSPVQVTVHWPGLPGSVRTQTLTDISPDKPLLLDYGQATASAPTPATPRQKPLLTEVQAVDWTHQVAPTNDFERQLMLPMQYSYAGPRLATGDVDGDGQPDAYVCGTPEQPGVFLLRRGTGFTKQPLPDGSHLYNIDAVLADFDGDHKPDLYVVNGGYAVRDTAALQDQLWLNDGKGGFLPASLPPEGLNGGCVKTLDVDRDGDLDLFVGGHVRPGKYPFADESFLLLNDGKAHFRHVSLGKLGIVSDAAVLDLNKDGWPDLVLAGEWMPITVFINDHGNFPAGQRQPYPNLAGWWTRLEKADLDGDGDDDLIVGNLGLNTQIRATEAEPATLAYDDFDHNGTIDCFMSYYIQGKSYPAHTRDEVGEQMPTLRKVFKTYADYADATIDQFFDPATLKQGQQKTIDELQTLVLENKAGQLIPHSLPQPAQYAPVYGILAHDFDHNGTNDLLLMGNNSGFRLRIGKVDANYGVMLRNKGNWRFEYVLSAQSGLLVKGDVRDVKRIGSTILIGICNGKLRTFDETETTKQ